MIKLSNFVSKPMRVMAVVVGTLASGIGLAQTIQYPTSPLYLTSTVEPNVMVSIDNSGSTDWEVAFNAANGEAWWNPSTTGSCNIIGFAGCGTSGGSDVKSAGTLNFNTAFSGHFYGYDYLFPNGDRDTTNNPGGRLYTDSGGIYAIPPFPVFGWARDADYNGMYFDPTQSYAAWPSDGTTTWSNATPTAANMDPASTTGTIDLTNYVAGGGSAGSTVTANFAAKCSTISAPGSLTDWGFQVYSGMTVPVSSCIYTTYNKCTKITGSSCTTYSSSNTSGWVYVTNAVAVGSSNQVFDSATSLTSDANAQAKTSISSGSTLYVAYFPATFYVAHGTDLSSFGYLSSTATTGYAPDGTTVLDGYQIVQGTFGSNTTAYNTAIQNFANWFVYYRKRYLGIRAGVALSFDPINNLRSGFFTINNSSGGVWSTSSGGNLTMYDFSTTTGSPTPKQTFFNSVYTYARGAWGTPNRQAVEFMGNQLRRSDSSAPIQYSCQQNFTMLFTDGYAQNISGSSADATTITDANGDGNLSSTSTGAAFFERSTTNPNNDSVTLPTYAPYPDVSNESSGGGVSYTMADRAMYDYSNNLRPDLLSSLTSSTVSPVPVPTSCGTKDSTTGLYPTQYSATDCNPWLHSVFYGIILNSQGFVYTTDPTSSTYAASVDPYAHPPSAVTYPPTAGSSAWSWPTLTAMSNSYTPAAVDDMWHATVNSRGKMFNAQNTTQITQDLQAVLADIAQRTSSSSSIAVTSSNLITGSDAYLATFNSANWSGDLQEYVISANSTATCTNVPAGQLCTPAIWDASCMLTPANTTSPCSSTTSTSATLPSGRVILTYDGLSGSSYTPSRKGVAFNDTCTSNTFSSLPSPMQALLNINGSTLATDTNGCLRLSYLRGVRTQEASGANPQFRTRGSVLGDIIDSSPFYVGPPSSALTSSTYSSFATTYSGRTPMVYVGANDGMLHGFETTDGKERIAYVPSKAFGTATNPMLAKLTATSYTHEYIVDASPVVGDAQLGSSGTASDWHTVLVSGLGYGGQGVFALDVTDPTKFAESNAASLALWEFTDADDANLGNVFGQPTIVQMHDGNWWAVVGGGYNVTTADGNASTTGHAALFLLKLNHTPGTAWTKGTDYIRIDLTGDGGTTTSPNGLSTPAVVDVDGDGLFDRIYAGDLKGNLWRFDVTSSSPGSWAVGNGGVPLFQANDGTTCSSGCPHAQPITDQPEVGLNLVLNNTVNVYFGTGRYLDANDNSTTSQNTQSFYAIFDENKNTTITRSTLQAQTITNEETSTGTACTVSVSGTPCYRITSSNAVNTTSQNGWYMDLTYGGSNNGERIVQNPILYGGLIILQTLVPSTNPCSYGGTGWIMELNETTGAAPSPTIFGVTNGNTVIDASGEASTVGIMAGADILTNGQYGSNGKTYILINGTNGTETPTQPGLANGGRISWRELVNY